jgi:cholesterol transport system auxiliary component
MMRAFGVLLALLSCACATERPAPIRYDLNELRVQVRARSNSRLDATIAISPVHAPSWLRTTALLYRLDYVPPARPRAYGQSQWAAPPNELLSLRLRERISADNDGFTIERLPESTAGYRLEVTLEEFTQIFPSPDQSRCIVTLSVLLEQGDQMLAQKTFQAERPAPTADAAGAVVGLMHASDADIEDVLIWLQSTLPKRRAAAVPTALDTSE